VNSAGGWMAKQFLNSEVNVAPTKYQMPRSRVVKSSKVKVKKS